MIFFIESAAIVGRSFDVEYCLLGGGLVCIVQEANRLMRFKQAPLLFISVESEWSLICRY